MSDTLQQLCEYAVAACDRLHSRYLSRPTDEVIVLTALHRLRRTDEAWLLDWPAMDCLSGWRDVIEWNAQYDGEGPDPEPVEWDEISELVADVARQLRGEDSLL